MSTRMIGGVIMTHGDDKGLVLPPRLAPYQVVIVPIGRGEQAGRGPADGRGALARAAARAPASATHVDDRPQLSPGFKFNDWELRGVPIRLELGPRDLAAGTALMARRLGAGKDADPAGRGARAAGRRTGQPSRPSCCERATVFRDQRTVTVDTWEEFEAAVATGMGPGPALRHSRNARTTSRPQTAATAAVHSAGRRAGAPGPASAAAGRRPTASASSSAAHIDL